MFSILQHIADIFIFLFLSLYPYKNAESVSCKLLSFIFSTSPICFFPNGSIIVIFICNILSESCSDFLKYDTPLPFLLFYLFINTSKIIFLKTYLFPYKNPPIFHALIKSNWNSENFNNEIQIHFDFFENFFYCHF